MTGNLGFSYIGLVFLLLLFIPNIIWTRNMPQGYTAEQENKILLFFERTGEAYEQNCEAKLSLFFNNNPHKYMIIIYDDHCSFQRCGTPKEQSGEFNYQTLDELYQAQQIDDIILARDWDNIRDFDCMDFDAFGYW